MQNKKRGMAPFKGKIFDRLPFWYMGHKSITLAMKDISGAESIDDLLYNVLHLDYKTFRPKYIGEPKKKFSDGTEYNEWGVRRNIEEYGPPLNEPLKGVETVSQVESYNWPDPSDWDTVIDEEDYNKYKDYCIIGGAWAPFFHDASELVGMEDFFVMLYTMPEVAEAIIDKCFTFYYQLTEKMYKDNPNMIDILFFGNDYGTQQSLLLSVDMWRKFFKKPTEMMTELGHQYGLKVAMHSCGAVSELIPELIECGIDCLNPIQVTAKGMDPVELKKQFGKDIVFFGGIDLNEVIMKGTEKQVRDETRRIVDVLGHDGRYIVAPSQDDCPIGTPPKNILALYDEAIKYFK